MFVSLLAKTHISSGDPPGEVLVEGINWNEGPHSQSFNQPKLITEDTSYHLQIPDIEDICGCLVTVYKNMTGSYSVRFSHYTVLEYLVSDRIRHRNDKTVSFFSLDPEECRDSHLRQTLAILSRLGLDMDTHTTLPDSPPTWTKNPRLVLKEYCFDVAFATFMRWGSPLGSGEHVWEQSGLDLPRLLRDTEVSL